MAESITTPSERPEAVRRKEHQEDVKDVAMSNGYDDYGLVKSRFDELSILETLWVFKRVVLVTLAVYTGYVCEGFEVSEASRGTWNDVESW